MMDRIVIEKNGRHGIVLEPDGTFRRVRIPEDIETGGLLPAGRWHSVTPKALRLSPVRAFRPRRLAAAMVIALVISLTAGIAVYASPVSYVSLDMSPGISLTLNRFDLVISAEGMNPEGKAVLAKAQVLNRSYADSVHAIFTAAKQLGYMVSGGTIVVAVASQDEAKGSEIRQQLMTGVQENLDELGIESDIDAEGIGVARVQAARALGITSGKLNQIEKIREAYAEEDFDLEDWAERSTEEVLDEVKRIREEDREEDKGRGHEDEEDVVSPEATESESEEDQPSESDDDDEDD